MKGGSDHVRLRPIADIRLAWHILTNDASAARWCGDLLPQSPMGSCGHTRGRSRARREPAVILGCYDADGDVLSWFKLYPDLRPLSVRFSLRGGHSAFAHFQSFRLDCRLPDHAPSIGIGKPLRRISIRGRQNAYPLGDAAARIDGCDRNVRHPPLRSSRSAATPCPRILSTTLGMGADQPNWSPAPGCKEVDWIDPRSVRGSGVSSGVPRDQPAGRLIGTSAPHQRQTFSKLDPFGTASQSLGVSFRPQTYPATSAAFFNSPTCFATRHYEPCIAWICVLIPLHDKAIG